MKTNPRTWCRNLCALVCSIGMVAFATRAAADASGQYSGSFEVPKTGEVAVASGSLTQTDDQVGGTITIQFVDPIAAGTYTVTGSSSTKKIKLKGANANGATIKWGGKWESETVASGKAKVKKGAKIKGVLLLNQGSGPGPEPCASAFFEGEVMGLVMRPICANCHVPGGAAQAAHFRVFPDDALATQQSVAAHIDFANPEASPILLKPVGQLAHGGGQQISPGSNQHQILTDWVDLVVAGEQCDAGTDVPMAPLSSHDLLVRASMDVMGRRPTPEELSGIVSEPGAYGWFVDAYLHNPAFLERVKEVYDDALLVRREDDDPSRRAETAAIYGEALELIAYIVANDLPFTQIGTADFTVANRRFQQNIDRMPFPMEPVTGNAWKPTHYLDGRTHAGILSTSAFYEVWDTNNTNKNRRRANRWSIVFHCYDFLATPVDVTRDVDNADANAVLNAVTARSDCKACHQTLDPLASFLFPYDQADGLESNDGTGFLREDLADRWRTANRRPPAVYGVPGTDLRDLGRLLTENPRFAECQTNRAFQLLFLRQPSTAAELRAAADIAARWSTEDNYNYRSLVRRWMLSNVYTGRPVEEGAQWVRRASPERFESMIKDLTGFVWLDESDDPAIPPVPRLTSADGFKVILGGIDGVSVTKRSYTFNASVALVQRKIATLAANYVVQNDLVAPDAQRKLLAGVSGDEDPDADEAKLRGVIARIGTRLYGESFAPDSDQVDVWFLLFSLLHDDTTQAGDSDNQVPGTQGERAWRGLLTAMLRSPRMLLY